MSKVLIVGIAGGSGSGKTTFAHAVCERLHTSAVVIPHDNYYRAQHNLSFEKRVRTNYDHPDAYENELMVAQLKDLRAGKPIQMPQYDFSIHDRIERRTSLEPAPVIIVEGITVFCSPELRELMDIKLFVEADADVRVLRRALRDVAERGRELDGVITQYLATVKPMHEAFVEPSKQYADLIIPANQPNEVAVEAIAALIDARAQAVGVKVPVA